MKATLKKNELFSWKASSENLYNFLSGPHTPKEQVEKLLPWARRSIVRTVRPTLEAGHLLFPLF